MHPIKNTGISERNKIDTQSRADAYIKRKRLLSMSDYNLKSGCTQKYSETEINPNNPLFWAKKKPKNPKKKTKKTKNPLGWFFLKNPGFFQPWLKELIF
jgi:hypothetical protein